MTKYITVADSYSIYEVQDEAFELLSGGVLIHPPQVVMEVLTLNGSAKKLGTIGLFSSQEVQESSDDEDEDPPEGEGPWVE